ncbi:MAG: single-stranded DNA-binding protein [Oscillospiraceae bacterium]|jgi:primosomal replication protein N|nr:single-stranded DNA-binding protein [Oscillospiraceae bacterium]
METVSDLMKLDMTNNNIAELCGSIAEAPRFSHVGGAEEYLTFPLEIERLSGALDKINVVARKADLDALTPDGESKLRVTGEVRSYNNKRGEGSRLVITVLAKELCFAAYAEDQNVVRLAGVLCKTPTLRKTPMGRQICDVMLAVNRKYGRSDYLPCIAWGKCAVELASRAVGERVTLTGRIQSRKYIKATEAGTEERTAFEVSIVSLDETAETDNSEQITDNG